jgi:hypothetical protein
MRKRYVEIHNHEEEEEEEQITGALKISYA